MSKLTITFETEEDMEAAIKVLSEAEEEGVFEHAFDTETFVMPEIEYLTYVPDISPTALKRCKERCSE